MKLRITTLCVIIAIAVALVLTTCSSEIVEEVIPEANLLALTVTTADNKTIVVPVIPAPIIPADWNDEDYTLAGASYGTILAREDGDTDGARLNPVVSPGARVAWGKARGGNRPDDFTDPRVPAEFTLDDFLYIRVTADDGVTQNYYRFYSVMASSVRELGKLSISGREAQKVPDPAASMETLIGEVGATPPNDGFYAAVDLTTTEALSALVQPEGQEANATFRYVVAPGLNNATPPENTDGDYDWQENPHMQFADGNILYVEVTAHNEKDQYYYAFRVAAGHIATIDSLKLDGVEVVGKGIPAARWNNVIQGSYATADQRTAGFNIEIVKTDPASVYKFVKAPTNVQPSSGWRDTGAVRVENQEFLVIMVYSASSSGIENTDTRLYKIQITMQAAVVTQQPKSTTYFVQNNTVFPVGQYVDVTNSTPITLDRPIEELSVTLDRSGTYTYQWYTANSWYGGYGFDKDGKIAGNGAVADDYHAASSLDEKGNVSLHNGGNQYYRLPYRGTAIPGATSATYKPIVDASRRPFLSGFSNQTQYYWVIVKNTQNNYEVTSKHAAIVTEWGYEWNVGKRTNNRVDKKHHIVDLHAYTTPGAVGLRSSPKNTNPFTAGNHGDKYVIPMTVPPGFNIMEYSIVTCQAIFYLSDGREWIQNWTQGDFGFQQVNNEPVLWYNLTNDNATRGLSRTGNDPTSSSLDSNPTALIVQPAGTKPLKELPPFEGKDEYGRDKPKNNNNAQGWFTPYIEIVELRFEGPTRVTP